jgi:hypothetical protein
MPIWRDKRETRRRKSALLVPGERQRTTQERSPSSVHLRPSEPYIQDWVLCARHLFAYY